MENARGNTDTAQKETTSPTEQRQAEILLQIKNYSKTLLMSGPLQVCKEVELKESIKLLIVEFDAIETLSKNIEKTSPT